MRNVGLLEAACTFVREAGGLQETELKTQVIILSSSDSPRPMPNVTDVFLKFAYVTTSRGATIKFILEIFY